MLIGRGEWAQAESELAEATERLALSRPLQVMEGIEQLAELRRRQGRFEEAEELFARTEGRSLALLGRAFMAADRNDAEGAADLVERFLRRTPPDNWNGRASALELLVRTRLALRQVAAADEARDELSALVDRIGTDSVRACLLLADGARLAAQGEHEHARRALEDAVDVLLRQQAPFEAARARLGLARCLAALGRPGAARQEALAALESFQRLGAAREAFRAEGVLKELASPGAVADSGLTAREVEVLRLVAAGLGDKEIAERLFLSGHTVHRHISNIRTKLGLPSRAAAVAWAARSGVL
jgi:DNA-binding CsgD family transcriptional regulator